MKSRRKKVSSSSLNLDNNGVRNTNRSFSRDSYTSPPTVDYSLSSIEEANVKSTERPGSAKYAHLRKSRKRKKIAKIVAISILAVLVIGVGSAFAYINYLNGHLNDGMNDALREALVPADSSEPFYMLILGVDKSEDREDSGEFGSYRCDTMILTRVDTKNKKVSMVSMPRDLQIQNMGATTDNPEGYGVQKLNAAYAFGGAALCVQTVSKIAGVSISHYVEADFDGFTAAVDAVGGVEIDVQIEIDDEHTAVYVPAGKQTLNGAQALSVCRSRHTYDYLGDGDALRTAYQRQVLSAVASKVLASDVGTIFNTINSLVQYVNTDFDVNSILSIARALQGMDSSSIYTATMPKTSKQVDGVWYDFVYSDEWKTMMARMDAGQPPADTEVDEATGIVVSSGGDSGTGDASSAKTPAHSTASIAVRNGTSTTGIASGAVEKLKSFGYTNVSSGNANSTDYTSTLIIYDNDTYKRDAEIIAAQLGCGTATKNDGSYTSSGNVMVVLGTDYAEKNSSNNSSN
jgi:polyisoprenyl-teichoic acid--peptidoglycan teichoic acid transferase